MRETTQEVIDAMRSNVITTSAKIVIVDNEYNTAITTERAIYTIFEDDGINLDGSECVLEKGNVVNGIPQIEVDFEVVMDEGYYFSELSNENKEITASYNKTIKNSQETDKTDLHIKFSELRNEYAVDFTVMVADNDGTQTYTYTNNTNKHITINNVSANCTVTVNITKWSKKYARPKILNIYTGTVYEYIDDDIISISGKKGVDLLNEEIESKDIEIKLVDKDNKYNIFDETSELAQLNNDARILIYIGVLIDNFIYYIEIDECYFKNIKKEDNELEMIINATGIISKYQNIEWGKLYSEIYLNQLTLNQTINGISQNYIKLKEKIHIDNLIIEENQKMIKCFEKDKKIHDFLGCLATNCRSNLVETYDNKIVYKRILQSTPTSIIDISNMEELPQIDKQDDLYSVLVKQYNYTAGEVEEVYKGTFILTEEFIYLTPYKNVEMLYLDNSTVEFVLNIYNSDGTIYASNITSEGGTYNIVYTILANKILFGALSENLIGKKFELTFKCKTLQFSNSEYKTNNYEEEKIIDVRSIQDTNTAVSVANWVNNNLKKKYTYKVKINDVFTYELGDTVELETGIYGIDNKMIVRKAIIVGIEYKYDGTLDYYLILEGE